MNEYSPNGEQSIDVPESGEQPIDLPNDLLVRTITVLGLFEEMLADDSDLSGDDFSDSITNGEFNLKLLEILLSSDSEASSSEDFLLYLPGDDH